MQSNFIIKTTCFLCCLHQSHARRPQAKLPLSDNSVVLNTTSVAGVVTSSDFFPSPCTLEVGQAVPEIPPLLKQEKHD